MIMTNGSIIPAAFWGQPIPGLITCQSSQPPSRKESSFHREEGTYIQTREDAERRLHTDTRRRRKAPPYRHAQMQKGASIQTRAKAERRYIQTRAKADYPCGCAPPALEDVPLHSALTAFEDCRGFPFRQMPFRNPQRLSLPY